MQQRAGLLFLAKKTERILLILEDYKWTVPTFPRQNTLLEDAQGLLRDYSQGRILPIELYLSEDKGFEYGTYVCFVEEEFLTRASPTICWSSTAYFAKNLHKCLKNKLKNQLNKTKNETKIVLKNDENTK